VYVCVVGLICGCINTCMMLWMYIDSMWMLRFMYEWAGQVGGR